MTNPSAPPLARTQPGPATHNDAEPGQATLPRGWRMMRSTGGHLYATRDERFPPSAEAAGAFRTVDGSDEYELATAAAAQEATARQAPPLPEPVPLDEIIRPILGSDSGWDAT
ncbi:hypothetical protein [Microtetraspora malaysiensis]|uniref:Uncharacterized protein n=1 Tax=Microtetraspora malaysiensis TaxID=161358 RepID=A0ABW6SKN8_9ACTN